MASNEEKAEKARIEAAEEQARKDREKELARRQAQADATSTAESIIIHGPAAE